MGKHLCTFDSPTSCTAVRGPCERQSMPLLLLLSEQGFRLYRKDSLVRRRIQRRWRLLIGQETRRKSSGKLCVHLRGETEGSGEVGSGMENCSDTEVRNGNMKNREVGCGGQRGESFPGRKKTPLETKWLWVKATAILMQLTLVDTLLAPKIEDTLNKILREEGMEEHSVTVDGERRQFPGF